MKLFRVSIVVVLAVSALMLTACATGPVGPRGATGARGPIGKTGATGLQGPGGSGGATGGTGVAGAKGAPGATGATGATGMAGPAGTAGSAVVPQYAYLYNLAAQTVSEYGDVVFSNSGDISSGLTYNPARGGIVVSVAGEYEISFSVNALQPNQFAVCVNGGLDGTNFGSGTPGQNSGTVILSAAVGDVLSVRSFGTSSVDLNTNAGGWLYDSDATLAVHKIG